MIGMLGGMGPESTAYTYMKMVEYCQHKFGARKDEDFPPVFIYSMPVPDVVEEGSNDNEVLALLRDGVGRLNTAGAKFSFIACNTMQGFIPALRKEAEVLSLVEESLKEAKKSGARRWGILGTEVTVRKGFYQAAFRKEGISMVEPDRRMQGEITMAIRGILSGKEKERARERLLGVASWFLERGAEGILLACTDLPIVVSEAEGLKTIDTAEVIARAAVDRWKNAQRLR